MKNKFWYFYITFTSISTFCLSRKLLIVRIFTQTPPTRILKLKYMTLNFGHPLKYDSKTQTNFFCIFCTASIKISFLPHFQTLQIIEYGPLKFFPHIPFENIYFYVPKNEEKIQIDFLDSLSGFLTLGHNFKKLKCEHSYAALVQWYGVHAHITFYACTCVTYTLVLATRKTAER